MKKTLALTLAAFLSLSIVPLSPAQAGRSDGRIPVNSANGETDTAKTKHHHRHHKHHKKTRHPEVGRDDAI